MSVQYTIGRLARAAGVPVTTVRYYERIGLIEHPARTESNYRVYGPAAVERLRFIRAAQAAGFSLEGIARLLHIRDGHEAPCPEVEQLIEARLTELDERIHDLEDMRAHLRASLKTCRKEDDKRQCDVLKRLSSAANNT